MPLRARDLFRAPASWRSGAHPDSASVILKQALPYIRIGEGILCHGRRLNVSVARRSRWASREPHSQIMPVPYIATCGIAGGPGRKDQRSRGKHIPAPSGQYRRRWARPVNTRPTDSSRCAVSDRGRPAWPRTRDSPGDLQHAVRVSNSASHRPATRLVSGRYFLICSNYAHG